jgi:outer membrane receptor protein involved in Fe transport
MGRLFCSRRVCPPGSFCREAPSREREKESGVRKSRVRSQKLEAGSRKPELRPSKFLSFALPDFRRGILRVIFVAILLITVGTAGLRAATLQGTVLDPDGRLVRGAHVNLLTALKEIDVRQTDAEGRYVFDRLEPGAYQLVATAPGFSTAVISAELRRGQTKTADLRLQLSAVDQHVVVSASLGGALAPEIGSSITVVTHREMERRDTPNALEALQGITGLDVNQTGRWGGSTGVFIRGGNSNYNLVMVDGIPVNQFGGDFDFASLPTDGVERIEVARGPQSALYGSNAVTGVINLISQQGDGPPHFMALAEAGSFNTHRFSAGANGLTRGWGWSFDLSQLISHGVVVNDRYRDQSAFFSLGYRKNPRRRLDFHFFGNANDAGAPGPYGSDPDQLFTGIDTVSRDKQNLFGYAASYAEEFSPRFRQVVTENLATNDYYFRSPFGDSYSNNWRGAVNTRSEISISTRDFFVAGIEYSRERIKNTYIADVNNNPFSLPRTNLAYFVENRWTPAPRLFVIAGVRVDHFHTHELPPDGGSRPLLPANNLTQADPRVSVAYLARDASAGSRLGATRFHGSFGTGIREPSGFELAFTDNPRLKPEKSVSLDSGIEQRFLGNRALVDATYFYNRFEDQIVVLGGSLTNLSTFTSANLGNSRAQGMELSFRLQPVRSLELNGAYTLDATSLLALEGANVALSPFRVGQPLTRRPKHSGFFNVTWQRQRLMLNVNALVRGSVLDIEPNLGTFACVLGMPCFFTNHGYTRADAGFSYRLTKGLELYGRLNNFLNQKYEESFGFPALRLNFLAGMKLNFPAE